MAWEGERGGFYFPYHYLIASMHIEKLMKKVRSAIRKSNTQAARSPLP